MKHVSAIVIKFLMIAVILEILLMWLTFLKFTEILIISAAVTLVSYLIGDLLVLSKSNNIIATTVDGGLSLIVILLFNYAPAYRPISFLNALICAVVIGIGEWFFHKYVSERVFPHKET